LKIRVLKILFWVKLSFGSTIKSYGNTPFTTEQMPSEELEN
jgi:hypothetical protein